MTDKTSDLCDDEGCPHHDTPHVCRNPDVPKTSPTPESVIQSTLGDYGVRLPYLYESVGIDERIALMALLSRRVADALRKEGML